MESERSKRPQGSERKTTGWRDLFSRELMVYCWLPFLAITLLHYLTSSEYHWAHDVYRRLYYVPIVLAALHRGFWGGLVLCLAVCAVYTPHAFFHFFEHDPSTSLEKTLEIVLYFVVGALCGELVDREEMRRKEAEEAQKGERGAKLQLDRAQRLASLGELVAGIAHEVKNPLHTLKGTAEIVDKIVPRDKEESPMWELHQQELLRLEGVSERFLSFARPSPPKCERVKVDDLFERVEELLGAQARGNNVVLQVEHSAGAADSVIDVDRDQIVQVLIDIALNGFSVMGKDAGGTMRLYSERESREKEERIRLHIENTGEPIPSDDLERIFDPFYTTRKDGTGLGLSTASRIIEQHQGFIEAKNLPDNQGVSFTINLPTVS